MTNLVANLYEDNRGRFWKLRNNDEELTKYCKDHDNEETHEKIQHIYQKLEFDEYLDQPITVYEFQNLKLRSM